MTEEKTPSRERAIPSLKNTLMPYLEIEGMEAAALVSTDGLLVAWAGERGKLDPESMAANAALALFSLNNLAAVLGHGISGAVNLGLSGRDLLLAPVTGDLLLVLIGRDDIIKGLVGDIAR